MTTINSHIWHAINNTSSDFLVSEKENIKYKELAKRIRKLSFWFEQQGFKKIVICSKSSVVVSELVLACLVNGITFSVIDSDIKQPRYSSIVNCFEPDIIMLDEGVALTSEFEQLVIKSETKTFLNKLKLLKSEQDRTYPSCTAKLKEIEPNLNHQTHTSYVLFTSGTTSSPKGVCISPDALLAHLKTLTKVYQYSASSKIFNALNLSHADGLIQGPILAAYNAITLVNAEPFEINRIPEIFDSICANEVSHFISVPVILSLIDKYGESDDALSQPYFKVVVSTGGHLSEELWRSFEQKYQCVVSNLYGLTETCAGGCFSSIDDTHNEYGTIGRPESMEAYLEPISGFADNEGVLHLKGANLMTGYLNNPEASQKVLSNGWLNTGDIARLNDNGTYTIIGREKSLINAGGYAVSPQEVEEALCQFSQLDNAYVTSRSDETYGEYIIAAVTSLNAEEVVIEEQTISYLREKLEAHKIPKKIFFLDAFPLGLSGKVNQTEIEQKIEEIANNQTQSNISNDIKSELLIIASRMFNLPESSLNLSSNTQNTPGWDSLNHLMLITELESEFNIQFSPTEIMSATSLQAILQYVEQKNEN